MLLCITEKLRPVTMEMLSNISKIDLNHNNQTLSEFENEIDLFNLNRSLNIREIVYLTLRYLQSIVGFIGNVFTLIIIKKLKSVMNGHILMAYLAISDICVCLFAAVSTFTVLSKGQKYWEEICVVQNALYFQVLMASVLSYLVLSIDR